MSPFPFVACGLFAVLGPSVERPAWPWLRSGVREWHRAPPAPVLWCCTNGISGPSCFLSAFQHLQHLILSALKEVFLPLSLIWFPEKGQMSIMTFINREKKCVSEWFLRVIFINIWFRLISLFLETHCILREKSISEFWALVFCIWRLLEPQSILNTPRFALSRKRWSSKS